MATYATGIDTYRPAISVRAPTTVVVIPRAPTFARTFLAGAPIIASGAVSARAFVAGSSSPGINIPFTHSFGTARTEGGGGAVTRPLVGLLHPPDRRGNRQQAATP